jgi:hypothetical protein
MAQKIHVTSVTMFGSEYYCVSQKPNVLSVTNIAVTVFMAGVVCQNNWGTLLKTSRSAVVGIVSHKGSSDRQC